jgi:hypothetical protein
VGGHLRAALTDFQASLAKIEDITRDIDANASAALAHHSVHDRHETIQCACTAILSGFFETFLKQVAESFIDSVSALNIPFTALPEAIRKAHYANGGAVLQGKQNNKGKYLWVSASPDDIARRLASVSQIPYELLWEAFADTQANPSPDVVKDLLRFCGLTNAWSKVVAKAGMTENTMANQLTSFLAVRNECAHRGKSSNIPSPNDIRTYCTYLTRLGLGIVEALEDHFIGSSFDRSLAVTAGLAPVPTTGFTLAGGSLAGASERRNLRSFWKRLCDFVTGRR